MASQSISQILAANLAYFMQRRELTEAALGKAAGLGQTTVGLYLNPDRRKNTATGKKASPKLENIHALAGALGVELWELLRPLSPAERDLLKSIDALVAERASDAPQPEAIDEALVRARAVIAARRPKVKARARAPAAQDTKQPSKTRPGVR